MSNRMERPPNIRHYAALAATVRHGSLSRAARTVNLSPPALTQGTGGDAEARRVEVAVN